LFALAGFLRSAIAIPASIHGRKPWLKVKPLQRASN